MIVDATLPSARVGEGLETTQLSRFVALPAWVCLGATPALPRASQRRQFSAGKRSYAGSRPIVRGADHVGSAEPQRGHREYRDPRWLGIRRAARRAGQPRKLHQITAAMPASTVAPPRIPFTTPIAPSASGPARPAEGSCGRARQLRLNNFRRQSGRRRHRRTPLLATAPIKVPVRFKNKIGRRS
jgi:hypothetical protein